MFTLGSRNHLQSRTQHESGQLQDHGPDFGSDHGLRLGRDHDLPGEKPFSGLQGRSEVLGRVRGADALPSGIKQKLILKSLFEILN